MNHLKILYALDSWSFTGSFAKQNNLFWLHKFDLLKQVGQAGLYFVVEGMPIFGGDMLDDVCDEYVLSVDAIAG